MNQQKLIEMSNGDWYIKEYDLNGNVIKIETNDCYTQHFEYDENNIRTRNWYEGFSNQKMRNKNRK
jgi:hypothetical protein